MTKLQANGRIDNILLRFSTFSEMQKASTEKQDYTAKLFSKLVINLQLK